MIYLNYSTSTSSTTERISDDFLYVNACGIDTEYYKHDYAIARPKGRADYHFLIVIEGCVLVTQNGVHSEAKPGDMVYYEPNSPQYYTRISKPHTKCFWLHICGTYMPRATKEMGLTGSGIYHIGIMEDIKEISDNIIILLQLKFNGCELALYNKLFYLFTRISRSLNNEHTAAISGLDAVLVHMHEHFFEPLNISFYTEMCKFSKSHFFRIFKEKTGLSPAKYITHLRINHAKELLSNTDYNISEVSYYSGYDDPQYFSRIFKKETGFLPNQFKKYLINDNE